MSANGNRTRLPAVWFTRRFFRQNSVRAGGWFDGNLPDVVYTPGGHETTGVADSTAGEFPGPPSLDGRIPFSTQSGGMAIFALPLDVRQAKVTGELVRIGQGEVFERHPTLTSDGRKMVFVSDRAGTNDVWMKDRATGENTVLIGTPEN